MYLREWLPWVDFTKTISDSKQFIEGTMKQFCNNNGFQAGIWYKGELAGVIDYCFNELKLNRIEIRVATKNHKSLAIPEKLGFQKEGCLRSVEWLYNKYVDHFVFSLTKDDYSRIN